MALAARERGLEYIAHTDHSATHGFGNHVDPDTLKAQIEHVRELNEQIDGIELLIGTETNILPDGSPDYEDDLLAQLDWVVGSVHTSFGMAESEMTKRIVAACEHPWIDAIGHPTGRKIERRKPYAVDMNAVIEAAARTGTMLEINAAPDRRDLNDVHARNAAQRGREDPHRLRRARRPRAGARALGHRHRPPRLADEGRRRQHALVARVRADAQARAELVVERFRTIIEPFRIHSVEPIRHDDARGARARRLEAAGHNLFRLRAEDVAIDLLTDCGTGAMSAEQWAGIQRGDESYAGSPSFYRFEAAVKELFPFEPRHPDPPGPRGRAHPLQPARRAREDGPEQHATSTPRARTSSSPAPRRSTSSIPEGRDPPSEHPFKGNMDLAALERVARDAATCPVVFVTVTNNAGGGQPVSLENLRGVRALCDRFGVPLFLDACRFAENAWFIKQREPGQRRRGDPRHRARDGVARRRHDDVGQEGRRWRTSAAGSRSTTTSSPSAAGRCSSSPRASPPTAGSPGATSRRSRRA